MERKPEHGGYPKGDSYTTEDSQTVRLFTQSGAEGLTLAVQVTARAESFWQVIVN